ncbi:MAG: helix-hairpin-helix domain-containing protein [Syntrophaceae bacterium]|nr:helix-hairpin-helix domain-containing protein [Syntrophaceae bacterium]
MRKDFLLGSAALLFLVALTQLLTVATRRPNLEIPAGEPEEMAVAVELVVNKEERGIFFVSSTESVSAFLLKHALQTDQEKKTILTPGMSIHHNEAQGVVIRQMVPHKKMALGIPLDLNLLSPEEIMLAPSIGEKTANKIYQYIKRRGCIYSLSELAEIPGIKEKKIEKLKPYFKICPDSCKESSTAQL